LGAAGHEQSAGDEVALEVAHLLETNGHDPLSDQEYDKSDAGDPPQMRGIVPTGAGGMSFVCGGQTGHRVESCV
jgi:hypothetical protein